MTFNKHVILLCEAGDSDYEQTLKILTSKLPEMELIEVAAITPHELEKMLATEKHEARRIVLMVKKSYPHNLSLPASSLLSITSLSSTPLTLETIYKRAEESRQVEISLLELAKMTESNHQLLDLGDQPFWREIGVNSKKARRLFASNVKAKTQGYSKKLKAY